MDYYISSDLIEVPEAQEHYTERLVRLTTLPTYQYRQQLQQPAKDRAAFGLSDAQHVYLCAQNVRKLHPEFDRLLGGILRRDPAGVLVLVKPEHEHIETALRDRFRQTMGDAGGGLEKAVTFSTLIASGVARAVAILLRAVSFERLTSFPNLLQGRAYLNRLLPCFLRLRRTSW
jgi:hypothetical protein